MLLACVKYLRSIKKKLTRNCNAVVSWCGGAGCGGCGCGCGECGAGAAAGSARLRGRGAASEPDSPEHSAEPLPVASTITNPPSSSSAQVVPDDSAAERRSTIETISLKSSLDLKPGALWIRFLTSVNRTNNNISKPTRSQCERSRSS